MTGFPRKFLAALQHMDPARLRPPATLYLHLHQAALSSSRATGRGAVVKAEDAGSFLPEHLPELLGDALVQVSEVIDLNGETPIASYVHPQWLRDQVQLVSPRTGFPHSTSVTRKVDYDHPDPYRTGSTGQTGLHNSCPLGRYQHRVKTHAHWSVRQPEPGTYVWRSPHHRYRLVDPHGTRIVDETLGRAVFTTHDPDQQRRILRSAQPITIFEGHEAGLHLQIADDFPGLPAAP